MATLTCLHIRADVFMMFTAEKYTTHAGISTLTRYTVNIQCACWNMGQNSLEKGATHEIAYIMDTIWQRTFPRTFFVFTARQIRSAELNGARSEEL
jgi:hypothetical protein